MSRRPTVYLFDIDGTIITTGGEARGALLRSFEAHLGLPGERVTFSFAGMTDRAIIRRALAECGQRCREEDIDAVLEAYLELLPEAIAASDSYRVHRGVREAIEALHGLEMVSLGLGTGNVERGARIKLERADLNRYFPFGGFGCSHELRPELIRIGAERGAALLGQPREACRVVVIGDTPRDVEAAQAIGAECVAVATGGASAAALEACGADYVFEDLSAPGALDVLLQG